MQEKIHLIRGDPAYLYSNSRSGPSNQGRSSVANEEWVQLTKGGSSVHVDYMYSYSEVYLSFADGEGVHLSSVAIVKKGSTIYPGRSSIDSEEGIHLFRGIHSC